MEITIRVNWDADPLFRFNFAIGPLTSVKSRQYDRLSNSNSPRNYDRSIRKLIGSRTHAQRSHEQLSRHLKTVRNHPACFHL